MNPRTHQAILSALVAYDERRKGKSGHNPYFLAHACGALQRAEEKITAGMTLAEALADSFCGRLLTIVEKAAGLTPSLSR